MNHWLMKSEPSVFGLADFMKVPKRTTMWDGVRNYQARNMLRDQMRVGDQAFLYHSNCDAPGIYGVLEVVKAGYPDPTQFIPGHDHQDLASKPDDPRWYVVNVQLMRPLATPVLLETLKNKPLSALNEMLILRRGNRLSVTPITAAEWKAVLSLEAKGIKAKR